MQPGAQEHLQPLEMEDVRSLLSLGASRKNQFCRHLDFSPFNLFWSPDLQTCKRMNLCCFWWLIVTAATGKLIQHSLSYRVMSVNTAVLRQRRSPTWLNGSEQDPWSPNALVQVCFHLSLVEGPFGTSALPRASSSIRGHWVVGRHSAGLPKCRAMVGEASGLGLWIADGRTSSCGFSWTSHWPLILLGVVQFTESPSFSFKATFEYSKLLYGVKVAPAMCPSS